MVLICLQNNILFWAKHIPGVQNWLADSLSRLQIKRLQEHVPQDGSGPDSPTLTFETRELGDTLRCLLESSLSATSLSMYSRPWQMLRQFKIDRLPVSTSIFPSLVTT